MQGYRYEKRKKKRLNKILNVAIGVVAILILVFAVQIFSGKTTNHQETMADPQNEDDADSEPSSITDPVEKELNKENQSNDLNEVDNKEETEEDQKQNEVSELEPIGTIQTGEFTHNFDRESENWTEMTRALQYASGYGDNMSIWRLENGGSSTRARGVVSGPDNPNEPLEIYIEWVDGQGWMPVEKQQLANNPYKNN